MSGQTREHAEVARALGVRSLIVAVNQMDCVGWSRERFEEVRDGLAPLLDELGFSSPPPAFVPLSALHGANLSAASRPPTGLEWYQAAGGIGSLMEAIDAVAPCPRTSRVGTRMCVSEVARSGSSVGVSGTLQAGTLAPGQKLLLTPSREVAIVKSVRSRGVVVPPGQNLTAGDHCELTLGAIDPSIVGSGHVLCDPLRVVPLARRVEVRLRALAPRTPLTRGQPFELYVHAAACCATLRKIVTTLTDTDSGTSCDGGGAGASGAGVPPPRSLATGARALVQFDLEQPVPLETYADCPPLGRVVIRDGGATVAVGVISAILREA